MENDHQEIHRYTEREHEAVQAVKAAFWLKIAATTFGIWALMIPVGIAIMRDGLKEVTTAQVKLGDEFRSYVLASERRLTLVEDRQSRQLERLVLIERDINDLVRSGNGNARKVP